MKTRTYKLQDGWKASVEFRVQHDGMFFKSVCSHTGTLKMMMSFRSGT